MSFISNLYFLPVPGLKMNIHIANLMDFLYVIIAELILYSCCTPCFVLFLLACIRILLITYLHIFQMLLFITLDTENKIASHCSTSPDNIFLPFVPVMHRQSVLKMICNCGKFCVSLMQNRVTRKRMSMKNYLDQVSLLEWVNWSCKQHFECLQHHPIGFALNCVNIEREWKQVNLCVLILFRPL